MAAPTPQQLVRGILALGPVAHDPLWVDAAALRLQSLYTGIERCLVQIVRVLNGGTPDGGEWHRRLLERMGQPTDHRPAVLQAATIAELQELLRFRHLVRHLYAYELRPEPVERLRLQALALWPQVQWQLEAFRHWLVAASAPDDATPADATDPGP